MARFEEVAQGPMLPFAIRYGGYMGQSWGDASPNERPQRLLPITVNELCSG